LETSQRRKFPIGEMSETLWTYSSRTLTTRYPCRLTTNWDSPSQIQSSSRQSETGESNRTSLRHQWPRQATQAMHGAILFILQFFLVSSSWPSNAIAIILAVIFTILAIAKTIIVIIVVVFITKIFPIMRMV